MAQTPPGKQTPAKAQSEEIPIYRRSRPEALASDAGHAAAAAFARAGFTDPALVLRWMEIAGPEVARLAQPLKFSGDTLTLKALPGAALFLAHEQRELVARINAYLGRAAIARIKFVQGGFPARPQAPSKPVKPGVLPAADPVRAFAGPEKLAEALIVLGRRRTQPPKD